MTAIIDALERAREGSRELDARIWAALEGFTSEIKFEDVDHGGPTREAVQCGSAGAWLDEIPHYTTSLDAALTLVPEGLVYCIDQPDSIRRELFYANIRSRGPNETKAWAHALTPALALCIAALRARQQ